jgi:hypothetical protein
MNRDPVFLYSDFFGGADEMKKVISLLMGRRFKFSGLFDLLLTTVLCHHGIPEIWINRSKKKYSPQYSTAIQMLLAVYLPQFAISLETRPLWRIYDFRLC